MAYRTWTEVSTTTMVCGHISVVCLLIGVVPPSFEPTVYEKQLTISGIVY
jgi:hypothetical protein